MLGNDIGLCVGFDGIECYLGQMDTGVEYVR